MCFIIHSIFFLLFKIIKLLVSSFGRSAEIGAFAAQFRDAGLRVRPAGGGQRQQDGGPGGRQLVRPAHAQAVQFLHGQEADQDRIERAALRSRRLPRQARLRHHGTGLQGHPSRGINSNPTNQYPTLVHRQ